MKTATTSEADWPASATAGARWARHPGPPVGPAPNEVAASTESQHEDGHDKRSRVDGVAEDVAEGADPYHLVNESAHSGREEREINQARAGLMSR